MKKFLVFAGDNYYPWGGMKDFKADFDTLDEVKNYLLYLKDMCYDWFQIYDTEKRMIVYL